jgi:tyrosinase
MLQSQLFAGDELLQDIADETGERISRTRHTPSASVGRIQTALLTWRADVLPHFGVDNKYGKETAGAVRTFKIDELGVNAAHAVDAVGPRTVIRLDEIQKEFEDTPEPEPQPEPEPDPDPVTNVRVRRDIWKLQPVGNVWHPIVLAYALGVQRMKKNLATDPTAWHWNYQRDVHGMFNPTDTTFVSQCQHSTSLFLPWHRMYLSVFEKVLIDIIATLPDVDDETKAAWALPYWDYDRTDSNLLPPAFRESKLPDGSDNPLREPSRVSQVNAGTLAARPDETTSQFWFAQRLFQVTQGPSFGGTSIGRHHPIGGAPFGELENGPHNAIHGFVGGLMNNGNTAAFDPIFWLHHANIDRCWEIWRQNTGAGQDPNNAPPWSDTMFTFRTTDPNTNATFAPSKVMDTATDLQYTYEDTSVPASAGVVPGGPFMAVAQNPGDRPLQRIGATDGAMQLVDAGTETVTIGLDDVAPVVGAIGGPHRVVLMLEHVSVDGENVPNYGAYVHPMGDEGEEVLVGVLSFFGLTQADDDAAPEYSFAFDLTDLVARLTDVGKWDPSQVTFSFRPVNQNWVAAVREESSIPTVTIGSVGLSIQ